MATQKHTLIIRNLHQSVTQEIIFVELKNRDLTPDNITISKPSGHHSQAFIVYKSKEKCEEAFYKLQFTEILSKQISCSFYQQNESEQKKYKIFLKNIPRDADPKQIFNLWTQFGKIQSITIFQNAQGKPTGSGTIQLSSDEEVKKCLDTYKQKIAEKEQLKGIEVVKFDKQNNKRTNGIYIRNIKLDSKTLEGVTSEKLGAFAADQSQKIQKAFQDKGITVKNPSFIFQKDQPCKALVYLDNTNDLQSLIEQYDRKEGTIFEIFQQIGYNNDVEIAPMEDPYQDYQGIYIKNLAPAPEGQGENYIKETIEKYMLQFGEISAVNVRKGEKPNVEDKVYPDSYFATIFMKRGKSGLEFIKKYQQIREEEFRNLFNSKQPYVTILLNKSQRKQMKKNILSLQKNESTQQQAAAAQIKPPMSMFPPMNPLMQQNFGPYQRRNPQFQNPGQIKPKHYNGPQPQKVQAPAQTQAQAQAQAQPQQQQSQFSTISSIRDDLQNFLTLEKNKQFQYLGLLMFPKVKAELEKDSKIADSASMAQKITGMMVDLTVFDVSEIIETLETPEEFKERLQEALELINQQSQN